MKTFRFTRKNILRAVWVLYAAISLMICLPQFDYLLTRDYEAVSRFLALDDGWEITVDGVAYRDAALEDFRFPGIRSGSRIIMRRILPESFGMTEAVLRLHIRHTALEIFIDGTSVFRYGLERMAEGKTVGSGFQFVNFPQSYEGKTVEIRLYPSEDQAFAKLDSIRLYEWENVYRALMTENRIPFFFGNFLIIFGFSTTCITVFALIFSIKFLRLLCVSLFSVCMGIWTMCYYNVMQIFSIPLYSVSFLEHVGLYLAPIPLFLYIRDDVAKLHHKSIRAIYRFLMAGLVICVPAMFVLHAANIAHLPVTLKYMQILIVCCLLYFVSIVLVNLRAGRKIGKMNLLFLIGMLIIAVCIGYDLAGYILNRYLGSTLLSLRGLSSIGIMIFIFMLIASFYIDLTKKMMQETERNSLIKSAYTDELTQLHNRRFCMEYMRKLQDDKAADYAIFCFDVNNLKTQNDTFGHIAGDTLIKNAAAVIEDTFGEDGIVARTGGDEFIAVLQHFSTEQADALTRRFRENLAWKNRETGEAAISIACGYAAAEEVDADIEKVYQLADDRMYENKKEMKAATPLP